MVIKNNKKILFVINKLAYGGAEKIVIDDINELVRRGFDVHLLTLRSEKEKTMRGFLEIPLQNINLIEFKNIFDFKSFKNFKKFLLELDPDLLISHLWFANTISRIVAKKVNFKNVYIFEQNVYDTVKTWKQFFLDKILQKYCRKIIAVSNAVKNSLIRHGIRPEKIEVLMNVIDVDKFKNAKSGDIKKDLGVKDKTLFITIGRLNKQKGLDILLKAFSRVLDSNLVIVGDGEEKESLENLAQELKIKNRVHFLGNRDDVPELLKSADCFVFSSRFEGTGIVVWEALASGITVVSTEFEVLNEIEDMGDFKILKSPVDDTDALAENMQKVVEGYRADNSAKIGYEYSIESHVDKLLNIVS